MPYHYRSKLSDHLDLKRKEGVIKDVDSREPIHAILNLVITEKKTPGEHKHVRPTSSGIV